MFYLRESSRVQLQDEELNQAKNSDPMYTVAEVRHVLEDIIYGYGLTENMVLRGCQFSVDWDDRKRVLDYWGQVLGQERDLRRKLKEYLFAVLADLPPTMNSVTLSVVTQRLLMLVDWVNSLQFLVPRPSLPPSKARKKTRNAFWRHSLVEMFVADVPILLKYCWVVIDERKKASDAAYQAKVDDYAKNLAFWQRPPSASVTNAIATMLLPPRSSFMVDGDCLKVMHQADNGSNNNRGKSHVLTQSAQQHHVVEPAISTYRNNRELTPTLGFLAGKAVVKRDIPMRPFYPENPYALLDLTFNSAAIALKHMHNVHGVWGWIEPRDIVFLPHDQIALQPGHYSYADEVTQEQGKALDLLSMIWSLVHQAEMPFQQKMIEQVLLFYPNRDIYITLLKIIYGYFPHIPLQQIAAKENSSQAVIANIMHTLKSLLLLSK